MSKVENGSLKSLNAYFEDLAVGDRFRSRARTITEADIATYSGLSGDYHPLHTDEEFARRGPFGGRIAQGCLTLSVATGLEFSMMDTRDESRILAFYGMDRVRFVAPVKIGDTIRLEGEVTALDEKDSGRGVVTVHQEIKNQDDVTVAVLDKRTLHARRAGDQEES
jgi:3-hydroxybutyryl-CoA dehydratase